MAAFTALITDDRFGWQDEERSVLEALGVGLEVAQWSTEAELIAACADADALLVNLAPITARLIDSLKRCRVIARYGVGLDNVDVAAAERRGIAVLNVSDYCGEDVAQHSLGLLLAMLRDIPARNQAVHGGRWNLPMPQYTVAGKVVGVFGFGSAGRAFCRAVLGLKPSRVLVYSPNNNQARLDAELGPLSLALGVPVIAATKARLLAESDIVSIHLRLCDDTQALFNEASFEAIKPGLFLVNTARGQIVDSHALRSALDSGKVAGAALDVLEQEPPKAGHPLLGHPRVLLSDHCAFRSTTSIALLKRRTAENAARGLGLL